jgi:UrcA family protein
MTNAASRIAGLATLALAALPIAALATGAHAAPVAVKVGDLNLNSAEGLATFHRRAEAAATTYCRANQSGGVRINEVKACKTGVRAEMADKLAIAQQAQLGAGATYAAR